MQDPYPEAKQALIEFLQNLKRDINTNDLVKNRTEIFQIEETLKDFSTALKRIQSNRIMYKIDERELRQREEFIDYMKNELNILKRQLDRSTLLKPELSNYAKALQQDNTDFIDQQRELQQDYELKAMKGLDRLEQKLGDVEEIGLLIRDRAREDVRELDAIGEEIEVTDNRIIKYTKKIDELIDHTSDKKLYFIICLLIFILLVTLIVIIFYFLN